MTRKLSEAETKTKTLKLKMTKYAAELLKCADYPHFLLHSHLFLSFRTAKLDFLDKRQQLEIYTNGSMLHRLSSSAKLTKHKAEEFLLSLSLLNHILFS